MKNIYISNIVRAVLMIAIQVLLLNNVYFVGFAVPILYGYIILKLPLELPKTTVLFLSFFIGLVMDFFMGTYGVHAAASTLIGFIRPFVARLTLSNVEEEYEITPSVYEPGFNFFLGYSSIMIAVHVFVILMMETFTFSHFLMTLLRIVISSLLSILLILLIDVSIQPGTVRRKSS